MRQAKIFPTRESKNAALAIERAAVLFGLPIVSYPSKPAIAASSGGISTTFAKQKASPHFFIPKKSPCWNGKVERVRRTVDEEFYENPKGEWRTLAEWLHWYNEERIHLSLGDITPKEKADQTIHTVTP